MSNPPVAITRVRTSAMAVCVTGLIGAGALLAALVAAPAAHSDTGYRYWSYWVGAEGEWTYATEGSGTHNPTDGDVEGWRFGIAGDDAFIQPSVPADFGAICSEQGEVEGAKRIAVIIDPGSTTEAPEGEQPGAIRAECVVADANATGYQVLAEVVDVRTDAGFVCGLDGYPASECAPLVEVPRGAEASTAANQPIEDSVASSSETTLAADATSGPGSGTPLVTAAVISLLAVIGFGIWRRRRDRSHTESA